MTKEQFFRWNVITNLCIALSVNTAATLLAGGDTISGWIIRCCMAFAINTVEAIIIPAGRIAKWFAEDICKSQPGKPVEFVARNFMINAIYVTSVSFCISLIRVGIRPEVVSIWWRTYPVLHVVGFITSMIIDKPVMYIALKTK